MCLDGGGLFIKFLHRASLWAPLHSSRKISNSIERISSVEFSFPLLFSTLVSLLTLSSLNSFPLDFAQLIDAITPLFLCVVSGTCFLNPISNLFQLFQVADFPARQKISIFEPLGFFPLPTPGSSRFTIVVMSPLISVLAWSKVFPAL